MKYEYDEEVDGLFIWFVDIDNENKDYQNEIWPAELNNDIGIIFSKNGSIMGMEILNASKYFDNEKLMGI